MVAENVQIPGIELLDELGRGTHSIVYRARRGEGSCAVKLPLRNETGLKLQILARRFRREAIALARLRHPLLPRVLEIGVVARSPYIAMELAVGETLAERLKRGPLDEDVVVSLGCQLAGALVHVHQSGLVHRDIKPRNVVFDRATGQVHLVDFSFAASVDAAFRILEPVGTLEYAAPEQISDMRQRVDGRADLYAVGCVLYECLAGSPPFIELDLRRLLHQHLGSQPPDVRDAAPQVSGALAAIIKRLLARVPDDRYPSAAALLFDLNHIRDFRTMPAPHDLGRGGKERPVGLLPLLGRELEHQRLRAMWTEVEQKRRQVVLIRGAAGSGKTRLVRAFVDDVVALGQPALVAHCHARDPKPFSAIRELVETYVNAAKELVAPERGERIAQMRKLAGDLAPLLKVLSPALSLVFAGAASVPESRDAQHIFVEGLAEFLVRVFRQMGSSIVFVDDVQWLDSSSRSVLRRAMERAHECSVMYVFAARGSADEPPTEAERSLLGASNHEIVLKAIDEHDTGELIGAYLGDATFDPALIRAVAQLSDGTPLSVLEILRMMLDEGLLEPSWGVWKFATETVSGMQLPRSTLGVLERRMKSLDEMTKTTLTAAAVVGMTFIDRILSPACGLEEGHVTAALAEARRAMLLEGGTLGTHRFVHDSVREALLKGLSDGARQEIHQRVAEAIAAAWTPADAPLFSGSLSWPLSSEDPGADTCYALANHFAQGVPGRTPLRVYESNIAAGRLAFQSFDNERALGFFEAAITAARVLQRPLDPELDFLIGEAKLRVGALEESLRHFRLVLEANPDPLKQALTLTRIAWIHEMQLDSSNAWLSLEGAFAKLDERLPIDSVRSVLASLAVWIWGLLRPLRPARDGVERARLEALCAIYYQTTRIASEDSKPLRMIQAALRGLAPAERLGPSPSLIRIYVILSFILTVLGLRKMGRKYLDRAERMASSTGDPVAFAHVLQVHSAMSSWAGNTREALEVGARCLNEYGHWRELSEYCLLCYDQQMLEGVRGRCLVAWNWIEHAIEKANQSEAAAHVLEFLELGARAALTGLGREAEADERLRRLRRITVPVPKDSGFYVGTHGPRVRAATEKGEFGPIFDSAVAEVKRIGYNPRRAHLSISEYYVHVAHARVHAVLRGDRWEHARLELVADALRDLKLAARIPLIQAHAIVIEAYWAMFSGSADKSEELFARAERLAEEEGAPWVLFATHRGRAHLYRVRGRIDSARDQAKLAEALAVEHGMAYRLQWIRDEFNLVVEQVPARLEEAEELQRSSHSPGRVLH